MDWRWSGLENKWSGLDWSGGKEGRLVKNPAPTTHFFEKTHKTQFQKNINFREKKTRRDTPSALIGVLVF